MPRKAIPKEDIRVRITRFEDLLLLLRLRLIVRFKFFDPFSGSVGIFIYNEMIVTRAPKPCSF